MAGDLTDERIGAARRRSDITDFFRSGLRSRVHSSGRRRCLRHGRRPLRTNGRNPRADTRPRPADRQHHQRRDRSRRHHAGPALRTDSGLRVTEPSRADSHRAPGERDRGGNERVRPKLPDSWIRRGRSGRQRLCRAERAASYPRVSLGRRSASCEPRWVNHHHLATVRP